MSSSPSPHAWRVFRVAGLDTLDAYRSGPGLCAIVGLLSGVVALGLGPAAPPAPVRAARPAEAVS